MTHIKYKLFEESCCFRSRNYGKSVWQLFLSKSESWKDRNRTASGMFYSNCEEMVTVLVTGSTPPKHNPPKHKCYVLVGNLLLED